MTPYHDEALKTQIAALLEGRGIVKVERLPTSGNNRLYLVESGSGKFVAKHYFTHAGDKRNRLNSEFSFMSFAFKNGANCLPRPIARDDENHIAIYSFVKGRKPDRSDVTKFAVTNALNFLVELNKHRDKAGKGLPDASESCFSIEAHIDLVERRVNRLSVVTDLHAQQFIKEEFVPVWTKLKKEILGETQSKGVRADEDLPVADRIISPSDFGFHNALIGEDGKFNFLDFEYAGWDDPAKTVGDFFSHLALPVPIENLGMFARGVAGLTSDSAKTLLRIGLLLRLYRIKWCCIALNHFVSIDSERRRFAGNDVEQSQKGQLAKARKLLDSMENLREVCHGLY
ncbi:MAG: phosphotransferase [Candidatus Omnitrophota bacterium]